MTARKTPHGDGEAPPGRPLRADAQRNREHVLAVAQEVFATEGLAIGMEELARRAGVGVGTFYRHFPTKEALFVAVVRRRVEGIIAEAEALESAKDPGTAFFAFFARLVEGGEEKKDLVQALDRAGIALAGSAPEVATRLRASAGRLLARAQRAGEVRSDVGVPELMALARAAFAVSQGDVEPRTRRRVIAVLCDGLRPGARAPKGRAARGEPARAAPKRSRSAS
jgi:AcrR family transcriptional regulator